MSDDECLTQADLDEALEAQREEFQQAMRSYKEQVIQPTVDDLEETVEQQEQRIAELEDRLNCVVSPEDEQPSDQETRVYAVREMLRRRAAAREHGTVSMTYSDVQDRLAENGHGEVHPQQAYRIMDEAGQQDGYAYTKDSSGQKVLRFSRDAVNGSPAVHNVNNATGDAATDGGEEIDSTTTTTT